MENINLKHLNPKTTKDMQLIAILGSTASGKSDLAIKLAQKIDAEIFSLDSLSIYKEIDIASAKPPKSDLASIKHYGIDVLDIAEPNNAIVFRNLLETTLHSTSKSTLLITGGTSFYLKSIIDGLSELPEISSEQKQAIASQIKAIKNPYAYLDKIDPHYANSINPKDTYRIQKALELFFASQTPPSEYFRSHPKIAFPYQITPYAIEINREILREKISLRTQKMLSMGIVEETKALIEKYPKSCQPFKAIGPKECISYLEGKISKQDLKDQIYYHTCQLAKRQATFNKTQFQNIKILPQEEIEKSILNSY